MNKIDLKLCLFCGGEASIKSVTKGIFVKKVGYFAACNSCGASTHVALNINDVPHRWNRRTMDESRTDKERSEARQRESL